MPTAGIHFLVTTLQEINVEVGWGSILVIFPWFLVVLVAILTSTLISGRVPPRYMRTHKQQTCRSKVSLWVSLKVSLKVSANSQEASMHVHNHSHNHLTAFQLQQPTRASTCVQIQIAMYLKKSSLRNRHTSPPAQTKHKHSAR